MSDTDEKQISAYDFICQSLATTPGTPYAFQDVREAGKQDVGFTLFRNDMPPVLKEQCAKKVCDALVISVQQQAMTEELEQVYNSPPIFTFADTFQRRLKNLYDEDIVDHDQLYRFGLMLARESAPSSEVKLGIYILSLFPNDIVKSILQTLGLHSEFTMTAIQAMRSWPQSNELIFYFAKGTTGYGRLAATLSFDPITSDKQHWLFYEAIKTPLCRDVIATHVLGVPDMNSFFAGLSVDEEAFHALSRLFAYAFEETKVKDFAHSRTLIDRYIEKANKYVTSFIDLAALVVISHSLQPCILKPATDVLDEYGWSSRHEAEVMEQCEKFQRSQSFRRSRLTAEMDSPVEDNSIIIGVLSTYTEESDYPLPDFHAFSRMLEIDAHDYSIAKFTLVDYPAKYAEAIANRILSATPEIVLSKPEMIDHDDLTPEFRPDIWLLYLLQARKRVKFDSEHLCLCCLSARLPDVRIEAINTLRLTNSQWSSNVKPALERACENEPDPKIVKRIKRLLGIKSTDKKEQKYVDVSDVAIMRSVADKPIQETEIAGTFFRDMDVVTGVLEEGDTLYLKREPENKYDKNAILVTTEDGYVLGYIPKAVNPPLANFMDAGEKLYAILEVDPAGFSGKPPITVMVSKAIETSGNVIVFPGSI